MDMSKAFDKVSHAALIAKLERYDTSGSLLDWFSFYLYNRRQRVTTLGATRTQVFPALLTTLGYFVAWILSVMPIYSKLI